MNIKQVALGAMDKGLVPKFVGYSHLAISMVSENDILDALVNAVTAARLDSNMETLPPEPVIDMLGLPMQMIYSLP